MCVCVCVIYLFLRLYVSIAALLYKIHNLHLYGTDVSVITSAALLPLCEVFGAESGCRRWRCLGWEETG